MNKKYEININEMCFKVDPNVQDVEEVGNEIYKVQISLLETRENMEWLLDLLKQMREEEE